ncbi:unnamed protein product [Thlaspi arvense]|uniref:Uncharacterized protein n=1 Tax=Thlaspi arvense TaxID=13288 RepID=A0AAU9SSM1_THLAR|nr:unnamed protein product [Thlaspi arvense]
MAQLHSTVGVLISSMAEILNSMAEMKAAVLQHTPPAQVGSVRDYLGEFEELASQLPADTSNFFFEEHVFVHGLKDGIKDMLRVFEPKGFDDIVSLARRLENSRFFGRSIKPPLDDSSPTDD